MKMKLKISGLSFIILLVFFFGLQSVHAADLQEWMKKCGASYVYIEEPESKFNVPSSNLTEIQAREIIQEEANKAGVKLIPLHNLAFEERYFYQLDNLGNISLEMNHSKSMYTSFINQEAQNKIYIPSPFRSSKNSNIFFPAKFWDASFKQKHSPIWQPWRFNPQSLVDFVSPQFNVACVYLSEDEDGENGSFLVGSPETLGDALYENLENRYSSYLFGIFTSCDEDTLRFQVRCFFAWRIYQIKRRLIE